MFNFKDFYKIRKYLFSFLILGVIFFAPLPFILLSPEGTARSSWVGIVDQGAINRINEARGNSNLSPFLSKLINNKVVYTVKVASLNYLNYFNPVYLGVTGGGQHQYSVPGFGLIFPEVLVFFYIGLGYLIIRIRNINNLLRLVIIWMVISPIPAAITRDPFQVVRSTTMLPVIFLVMGIGLWKSSEWLNKWSPKIMKPSIVLLIFIVLVSFGNYLYNYLYIYPKNDSFAWQYGYKQAMHYVEDSYDLYPKIYITRYYGEPHEFMLFYLKYDSNKLQKDPNLVRYYKNNWYWVDSFDKFVILDDEKIMDQTKDIHNALLITTPGNYLKQGQKIDQINFLDGSPAFDIIRL
jgi:hypothetical protein